MNRLFIIVLAIFISYSYELIAQGDAKSNFQNGYVLISEFDTIFGKIDNRNYYDNSQFCDFIASESVLITRYLPDKIFGYRFSDGKYYISKHLEIKGEQKTVFLEYLIHGKLDIYFYQGKKSDNHYYTYKDSLPISEIKYTEKIIQSDGRNYLFISDSHTRLLTYYMSDCPEISADIKKIGEPDHKKLIAIAKKYHTLTCKDKDCIVFEKVIPKKIKFSISGGSTYFLPAESEYNRYIFPSFGFNIMFQQTQKRERLYGGIGFVYEGKIDSTTNLFRVPLSVNFLNPRLGVSPVFSYEIDLMSFGLSQAIKFGFKYQWKKSAFLCIADLKTALLVIPHAFSLNVGMIFDLR